MIWAVYNGYQGNGFVCALVESDDERGAFEQAVDAFASDDKRPDFSQPNPRWHAEQISFPCVTEME